MIYIGQYSDNIDFIRLKALSCLYNCIDDANKLRFLIFKDILDYSNQINRIDLVLPYVEKIDLMID